MSRTDLWTKAALAMYEDPDPRWRLVAALLRSEAIVRDELEPFVELINVKFEERTGIESYIRLSRDENGDIQVDQDTSPATTAVAKAYLDTRRPSLAADKEGPSEGHTFRFTVSCRGSSKVVGDAEFTDDQEFPEDMPIEFEVRGWSLHEALYKATGLPFNVLMQSLGQCSNGVGDVPPLSRCAHPAGHEGDCEA